jgi:short-subunit dehydrogenase
VTGAASGIGRALAMQLHADGHDLLLVDRAADALLPLARRLGARPIVADLACPGDLERLEAEVAPVSEHLEWVVNCAGMGQRASVAEADWEAQRRIVDVNVLATMWLSQRACRWFVARGRGVLVNVASSAAFQPLASMACYAASKAFVLSYSEALWAEMEQRHPAIQVLVVCPSGTATGFQAAAGVRSLPGERLLSPSDVAGAIRRAVRGGRAGPLVVGGSGVAMSLLARVLPRRASARLWRWLMERMR